MKRQRGSEGAGGEGRLYVSGCNRYCAATAVFQAPAANNIRVTTTGARYFHLDHNKVLGPNHDWEIVLSLLGSSQSSNLIS